MQSASAGHGTGSGGRPKLPPISKPRRATASINAFRKWLQAGAYLPREAWVAHDLTGVLALPCSRESASVAAALVEFSSTRSPSFVSLKKRTCPAGTAAGFTVPRSGVRRRVPPFVGHYCGTINRQALAASLRRGRGAPSSAAEGQPWGQTRPSPASRRPPGPVPPRRCAFVLQPPVSSSAAPISPAAAASPVSASLQTRGQPARLPAPPPASSSSSTFQRPQAWRNRSGTVKPPSVRSRRAPARALDGGRGFPLVPYRSGGTSSLIASNTCLIRSERRATAETVCNALRQIASAEPPDR